MVKEIYLVLLLVVLLCPVLAVPPELDYIQWEQPLDALADIEQFQSLLWKSQHPARCSEARFLVVGAIHVAGLGSHLHGTIPALWRGLQEERVVLLERDILSVYGNPTACPLQNYECYYLPLSNCSLTDVHSDMYKTGQALRLHTRSKLPEHTLSDFPQLSRSYNTAWYTKELTRYFTRPNARLLQHVAHLRSLAGLDGTRFASLHYRSGTLLKLEGQRAPLWLYRYMLQRHAALLYPIEHVLVESDDATAFITLQSELKDIQFHRVPPSLFATSGVAAGTHVLSALRHSATSDHDEGLTLLATLELLSQGDFFLGAFSSNLGRFVYELMARRVFPPAMYDVDNDIWFGGGVSTENLVCSCSTNGKRK